MPLTKQLADVITMARALLAPLFAWLGLMEGAGALPLVVVLLILNWTADSIDGVLARMKPIPHQTWVGARDLEVDMVVSCGLLLYMGTAGFLSVAVAAVYLFMWGLYFWWRGLPRSLGMLFQTPIYAWFIWVAAREDPLLGWLMIGWIAIAIIVTWPKFPREIVPGFLSGLKRFWPDDNRPNR